MSDRVLFTRLCSSPVALATEAFTRSPIVSGVSFIAGLFAITSTRWVSASNIFSVLASVGLTGIWHALSLDGRCKSECAEQSAAHEQALRRQNGGSVRPRMHVISPPWDSGQAPDWCRGPSRIFAFSEP